MEAKYTLCQLGWFAMGHIQCHGQGVGHHQDQSVSLPRHPPWTWLLRQARHPYRDVQGAGYRQYQGVGCRKHLPRTDARTHHLYLQPHGQTRCGHALHGKTQGADV